MILPSGYTGFFRRRRKKGGLQGGFSLMELLMVLVLLGLVAAVTVPVTGRFLETLGYKKQVEEIVATLRYARLMAITNGKNIRLQISEDDNSVFILSGGVNERREFSLGEEDLLGLEPEEVVFTPEGQASPALLSFTRGERVQLVRVDPLTALPIYE